MQLPDLTKTGAVANELMHSAHYSKQYCTYVATRTLDEITAAFARQQMDIPTLPSAVSSKIPFDYTSPPGCGSGGYLYIQLTDNGSYLIRNYSNHGMHF